MNMPDNFMTYRRYSVRKRSTPANSFPLKSPELQNLNRVALPTSSWNPKHSTGAHQIGHVIYSVCLLQVKMFEVVGLHYSEQRMCNKIQQWSLTPLLIIRIT